MAQAQTLRRKMNRTRAERFKRAVKHNWPYYALVALPLAYIIVFSYVPMGGILIAFKEYTFRKGILGSEWVGLKYFSQFFASPNSWLYIKNTLIISLYSIAAGFPTPILLALMLNELNDGKFKKSVQMITYAPYFISAVVMVSIIMQVLDYHNGIVNAIIRALGGDAVNFMAYQGMFRHIYVWSGVWQGVGYGSILYIAALSGIDPTLYEAAIVDGASRFQKIVHIDIPGITSTIVIMLILNFGSVMSVGSEKVFLMQNNLNLSVSEVISTYVYKRGLIDSKYGLSTAVGLLNSAVNFVLLTIVNTVARYVGETSLW